MMATLQKIYQMTEQLFFLFDQQERQNRTPILERMNILIEERERLLKQLSPPYTTEETALGKQIIELNDQVQEKMNRFQNQLKKDMIKMNKQKQSAQGYYNPYKDI